MAAKLDGLLAAARRIAKFAGKSCRVKPLLSLAVALAALGGCRNDITRQNLESERFLDQYAAGRGLTRDQARDEINAKVNEQETRTAVENAENAGVKVR